MRFARTFAAPVLLVSVLAGCGEPQPIAPPAMAPVVAPAPRPAPDPKTTVPSDAEIRELIRSTQRHCGFDNVAPQQESLVKLGESAFPVYRAILADPKSTDSMVSCTCAAIGRVKTDRRQFVPLAIKRATAKDGMHVPEEYHRAFPCSSDRWRQQYDLANHQAWARRAPIGLLGEIGDERDAPILIPLLSDDAASVRYAAADALVQIGGQRELEALTACLKPGDPRRDANEIRYLTERRDELAKRLKEHPGPKTLTN